MNKGALEKFEELNRLGLYSDSLKILDEFVSETERSPELLVEKGRLIKLAEDSMYELEDAEECFKKALVIESMYTPALIELGWHYLNVLDNAEEAKRYFLDASSSCHDDASVYLESYKGLLDCIVETDGVNTARLNVADNERLSTEEREYILDKLQGDGVVFWD